jgi:uncharacterized protein (DUF58 family)
VSSSRAAHRGVELRSAPLIALKAEVDELKLARRLRARATVDGGHISRQRGRSTDYQESRAYQPGDDVRMIDWRLSARQPRMYTKVYAVERERPVLLVIDFSASMLFGTRRTLKSIAAAEAATALAWAAIARGDRVGALIMPDLATLKPAAGPRSVLRLIDRLVGAHATAIASPATIDWNAQMLELKRLVRPGCEIFLLTDGVGLKPAHEMLLGALTLHASLNVVRLIDPIERQPPPPGTYQFSASDGPFRLNLNRDDNRRAFDDTLRQLRASLDEVLKHLKARTTSLNTNDPVTATLAMHLQ